MYYFNSLKKYAVFDGRAQRAEYWSFTIINLIIIFILMVLNQYVYKILNVGLIYLCAILIPSVAVTVRRLHDTNKSGWMLLINFIPVVGNIWFIVLMLMGSNPGKNNYGSN